MHAKLARNMYKNVNLIENSYNYLRGETSASWWMLCRVQSLVRNNCDVGSLRVEQFNVWRLHLMDDLVLGVNAEPAVQL